MAKGIIKEKQNYLKQLFRLFLNNLHSKQHKRLLKILKEDFNNDYRLFMETYDMMLQNPEISFYQPDEMDWLTAIGKVIRYYDTNYSSLLPDTPSDFLIVRLASIQPPDENESEELRTEKLKYIFKNNLSEPSEEDLNLSLELWVKCFSMLPWISIELLHQVSSDFYTYYYNDKKIEWKTSEMLFGAEGRKRKIGEVYEPEPEPEAEPSDDLPKQRLIQNKPRLLKYMTTVMYGQEEPVEGLVDFYTAFYPFMKLWLPR
jgi:hypothetical protein